MPDAAVLDAPAPAATGTPAPSPNEPGAWRSTLPDDLRSHAGLSKFNDVNSLAKSFVEQEKIVLSPRLPAPQANWTEKEYGELYAKLGRPEKPEGYNFKPLENLPEGLTASPEQDKWFSEKAHKLGLTGPQATALREEFVNFQAERAKVGIEQTKTERAAQEAGLAKLKSEYGTKWDAAQDAAYRVVEQMGGKEAQEFLSKSGLGNNPVLIRMMIKIGQTLTDHSIITGIPRISGAFNSSPAQAQEELRKMDADPEQRKILTTASHPQHDALIKRRAELQRSMVPVEK